MSRAGNPRVTQGEPSENPAGSRGNHAGVTHASRGSHAGVTRDNAVTAADIDRHHELASAAAVTAVDHAREAGKLLLDVKAGLAHGAWLAWLAANVKVSPRQAQRYIAVAEGKTPTIRELASEANTTSVSHLMDEVSSAETKDPKPAFTPAEGYAYGLHLTGEGVREQAYFLEPSSKYPGYWFVTQFFLDSEEDDAVSTSRPMAANFVETFLHWLGLKDPSSAAWRVRECAGVRVALETVSTPEMIEEELARQAKREPLSDAIERMKRDGAAAMAFDGRPRQ